MKNLVKSYFTYLDRRNIAMLENTKTALMTKRFVNAVIYVLGAFFSVGILGVTCKEAIFGLRDGRALNAELMIFVLTQVTFCLAILLSVFSITQINNITLSGGFMSMKTIKWINRFVFGFVLANLHATLMPTIAPWYGMHLFTPDILSLNTNIRDFFMFFGLALLAQSLTMAVLRGIKMQSENELTI